MTTPAVAEPADRAAPAVITDREGCSARLERASRNRGLIFAALGAILLVGLALRLQRLGEVSVWFDEAFSRKMAGFGFGAIARRTAGDFNPPLYYWLLRAWSLAFGDSPAAGRSLSVLCGLATIAGGFLLVREAERPQDRGKNHGRRTAPAALLAAALLALSPFQTAWSQQVRMYALGAALAALSGWLLLRALRPSPARPADWAFYATLAGALLYTHVYGLFTVGAQFLFAAGTAIARLTRSENDGRRTLVEAGAAFGAVGLACLPWLGVFLDQRRRAAESFWTPPFRWGSLSDFAYGFFAVSETEPPPSALVGWGAAEFCFLLTVALLAFGRTGHRLIAVGFALPVAAGAAASSLGRNVLLPHYTLFAHAYLLCGVAVVATRIPTHLGRTVAVTALLAGFIGLGVARAERREEQARFPGLKAAAAYLDAHRHSSEPVLTGNPMPHAALLAHLSERRDVFVLTSRRDFPIYQGAAVMRDEEYLDPGELKSFPSRRSWAVECVRWNGGTWTVPLLDGWTPVSEARFAETYWPDSEIVVRCYERRPSAGDRAPGRPK